MDIKRREELFKKVHFVIVLISFAESSDLSFVLLMYFDTIIVESIWFGLGIIKSGNYGKYNFGLGNPN